MNFKKMLVLLGVMVVIGVVLSACGAPGPAGPAGPAGPQGEPGPAAMAADLTCIQCHNDTSLITGKETSWEESLHGSGTATAYAGGRAACAGCHSGGGFSDRIAAGITNPDNIESADPNPSRVDCRACHQIHTSYTGDDWALETTAAVPLYAFEGVTFDGGMGNLCANCHQPRRSFDTAVDGIVKVTSTHWGPHHGPQSSMLLGVGAAGAVESKPSAHVSKVKDTCVTCHMGGEAVVHTYTPNVTACQDCHVDAKNFDINGVQTEVEALADEVKAALIAKGMWDGEKDANIVGDYPEAQAAALWNYIYVVKEDKSMGVHNSAYTKAMLEAALEALK